MQRILTLLILWVFAVRPAIAEQPTVVCFGDSITKRGFPKLIAAQLGVEAINEETYFTRHERKLYDVAGGLEKLVQQYRDAAAEVAKKHKLPLVDLNRLLAKQPEWMSKDGVHPSEKGSEIIAAHISKAVAPLVTKVPQTFEQLWADFDLRADPLDIEVLKEWEEDGVIFKIVRYHIGTFKGKKSMMAAVYGYPKGATKLPGLLQIHGGGQYADHKAVLTNAKRGYATISIAWAGRISAPEYSVGPAEVKLFWDDAQENPNYKVTTDWGALDGYHAPSRSPQSVFPILPPPSEWTLDPVESPRNNSWYLVALGARRALTFLEQQSEVDADRLGVYGHSMGGKLTVMTAGSDKRVKAAAPSCGGISDRYNSNPLFRSTIGDDAYLRNISCPIVFLSPANDFHGRINDLQIALNEIQSKKWRVTCAAHHNHQDTAEFEVATQLWFDQYLKGTFKWPGTPATKLHLKDTPVFSVYPDASRPILSVDVYYCQQGQVDGSTSDHYNTIHRFWHHAPATKEGDTWTAPLQLTSLDKPLWVYANVLYSMDQKVTGAGYYYGAYTTDRFNLSSKMSTVTPEELTTAGIAVLLKPSLIIETFEEGWAKEWFSYKREDWPVKTHKVYAPTWAAPEGAKLSLDVRFEQANKLVIGLDDHAAEIQLKSSNKWQTITLSPADFQNAAEAPLTNWSEIKELRLGHSETLRDRKLNLTKRVGAPWKGRKPEFRNLRWLKD